MRVILGLPNAMKLPEKDSCNTAQGQEMEIKAVPLSRKEDNKCVGCVSPSRRHWRESAEATADDCSMQCLMPGDVEGCRYEQDPCSKSSEVLEEMRYHHNSTCRLTQERDRLFAGAEDDRDITADDIQRPVTSSNNSLKESSCQTGASSGAPLLSEEECNGYAPSQDCLKKCPEDSSEANPPSSLQCPSAMMSSPFLPSFISPNHLNPSLSSRPVSQPPASSSSTSKTISSNHSTYTMTQHVPISCKDQLSSCDEPAEECYVIVNVGDVEEFHLSGYSRTESSSLQQCVSASGPKGMALSRMTSIGSLSSGDGPMCRICHEGPLSDEDLLAPCHCSGTLTYQHRKCLEKWLQTRGKDACELCDYHFKTERKGRPFSEWIRQPERIRDRRNILTDCSCFTLLTPLVCVSTWLCLNGAYHYLNFYEGRGWEGVGLVTLASILILIYLFWSLMSLRYHCIVWKTWRREHQHVHVVMDTKDLRNNNNNKDIGVASSPSSKPLGSLAPSPAPSQASSRSPSLAPSYKSPGSCTPFWTSPRSWTSAGSYNIPLQAPLASITSL